MPWSGLKTLLFLVGDSGAGEKMNLKTNVGYLLSVGIYPQNNKKYVTLFKNDKVLAEASSFNSLEEVLNKLASDLRQKNEEPIPNDAPIKVVNGQLYVYQNRRFKSDSRFESAKKVPLSDEELTRLYFLAQKEEVHSAYLSWKFGI